MSLSRPVVLHLQHENLNPFNQNRSASLRLSVKKLAKSEPDMAKYSLKSIKDRPQVAEATPRQDEKLPKETIEREMTSFETVNSFNSGSENSCEDNTEVVDACKGSVSLSFLQRKSQDLQSKNRVLFQ